VQLDDARLAHVGVARIGNDVQWRETRMRPAVRARQAAIYDNKHGMRAAATIIAVSPSLARLARQRGEHGLSVEGLVGPLPAVPAPLTVHLGCTVPTCEGASA
jgi:hypothetical protein